MLSIIRNSVAAAAAIALAGLVSVPAQAEQTNVKTFQDIEKHFGVVPKFFDLFPETKLPALWSEYKNVQLNPDTALDAKTKQLIGLAVAAQAKCGSCIYFQTSAAFANGASFKEVQEAVAVSIAIGDWSKVLTDDTFDIVKQDTNALVTAGALKATPKAPAAIN
jgi:AhpD family alkylhydroperoxidase